MSKPKPVKPFFKINFEDLEIAESFFENEKHFSEFLLAVSYYYRGKDYTIKQKFVQRYFNTYKKTMDFIIESKKTGSDGGKQRVENQKIKEQTLEGVVEVPVEPNNKLLNINNKEEIIKIDFSVFWDLYGKKIERKSCERKWDKLSLETQEKIIETLPAFKDYISDKKYLPHPETYLNGERWNDEIEQPETKEEYTGYKPKIDWVAFLKEQGND